jgi:catechol 2,3-dioxygenase-like lactoylglutathione lyase family enzyme
MPGVPFGLSRIGQIHVAVTDVERATEFYRDRLGLPFLYAYPGMAFFDCDGVRLFLSAPEGIDDQGTSTLYFTVSEIRTAVTALEARGVDIIEGPHVVHRTADSELWMAFLKDPDGNVIGVMSEVPTT